MKIFQNAIFHCFLKSILKIRHLRLATTTSPQKCIELHFQIFFAKIRKNLANCKMFVKMKMLARGKKHYFLLKVVIYFDFC